MDHHNTNLANNGHQCIQHKALSLSDISIECRSGSKSGLRRESKPELQFPIFFAAGRLEEEEEEEKEEDEGGGRV